MGPNGARRTLSIHITKPQLVIRQSFCVCRCCLRYSKAASIQKSSKQNALIQPGSCTSQFSVFFHEKSKKKKNILNKRRKTYFLYVLSDIKYMVSLRKEAHNALLNRFWKGGGTQMTRQMHNVHAKQTTCFHSLQSKTRKMHQFHRNSSGKLQKSL